MKKSLNSKKVVQIGILTTSAAALITGVTLASTLDNSSTKQMNSQQLAGLKSQKNSVQAKEGTPKIKFKVKNITQYNNQNDVLTNAYALMEANIAAGPHSLSEQQLREAKKYTSEFLKYCKDTKKLPKISSIKSFLKQVKGVKQSKYSEIFSMLDKQAKKQETQINNSISKQDDLAQTYKYRYTAFSKTKIEDFINVTQTAFNWSTSMTAACTAAAAGYLAAAPFTFGLTMVFGTAAAVTAGFLGAHTALLFDALEGTKDSYHLQRWNHVSFVTLGYRSTIAMHNLFSSTEKVEEVILGSVWSVPFAKKAIKYFDAVLDTKVMKEL
ncbi:MAG: hypothetical protein HRT98_02205 [Mycoplasmatales bacterium]|nr:hypothetical protein [Mycoplasmatales bacterium]